MSATLSAVVLNEAGEAIRKHLVISHARRLVSVGISIGESPVAAAARATAYIVQRFPETTDVEIDGIEALLMAVAEEELAEWRRLIAS